MGHTSMCQFYTGLSCFLTASGYYKMMMYQQIDYNFHHWAWYMGHTSMSQFHTVLSRFLTAVGYCRKWCCINTLIIIFIIELGLWVILASPNFIRVRDVFWQLLVTIENYVVSTKLIKFSSLSLVNGSYEHVPISYGVVTFFDSCRLL